MCLKCIQEMRSTTGVGTAGVVVLPEKTHSAGPRSMFHSSGWVWAGVGHLGPLAGMWVPVRLVRVSKTMVSRVSRHTAGCRCSSPDVTYRTLFYSIFHECLKDEGCEFSCCFSLSLVTNEDRRTKPDQSIKAMRSITRQVDLQNFTRFGLICTTFSNLHLLLSYITPDLANCLMKSGATADGLFLCD